MFLLLLMFSLFSGDMQIVLKNGKIMTCDSYEVKGRMVYIHRSGQTFMLPLSTIDLESSGPIVPPDKRVEEKKEPVPRIKKPVATRRPISLTTKDLRSISRSKTKGVIQFRKIGNSVIVDITINGAGPFPILLDTGASTTVIKPSLMRELNALTNGRAVPMVGVSGQPVTGRECKLDSISLAEQELRSFTVVSFEIPHLTDLGVVGLLGQDFLNHFILNMDSSINQITLTPHGQPMGPSKREQTENLIVKFESWDRSFQRLAAITRSTGNYLQQAARTQNIPPDLARKATRDLTQYLQEMSSIRSDASSIYSDLSQLNLESLKPRDRRDIESYLNCYSELSIYLAELQGFCGRLKSHFINPKNSRLIGNLNDLIDKQNAVINCK